MLALNQPALLCLSLNVRTINSDPWPWGEIGKTIPLIFTINRQLSSFWAVPAMNVSKFPILHFLLQAPEYLLESLHLGNSGPYHPVLPSALLQGSSFCSLPCLALDRRGGSFLQTSAQTWPGLLSLSPAIVALAPAHWSLSPDWKLPARSAHRQSLFIRTSKEGWQENNFTKGENKKCKCGFTWDVCSVSFGSGSCEWRASCS